MNTSSPLVSICIPAYNGATTLSNTLDKIVPQLTSEFEVIISDDSSTDETLRVAQGYHAQHSSIKVFKNDVNLGMDGNFHKTTQLATGKYIWFCGQDDYLEDGILKVVVNMLCKENIGILNLNFSQYDHNMKECLTRSFFEMSTFNKELVENSKELYFDTPDQYYQVFTQPPSFLLFVCS